MKSPTETRERRLRRRHGLDDVRGNVLFSYECRILDLSERGMAVRTTAPLAPGRIYAVKIQHGDRQIQLSGTVAWCRLQGTEKTARGESVAVYTAGLELAGRSDGRAGDIQPLLEASGVARLEREIRGRLAPRSAARTEEPSAPAVVREISRNGMVIEAPFPAQQGDLLDLELELGEEAMTATVRVVRGRPLGAREVRSGSELTVEYAEMTPAAQSRLDRLLREELGLAPPPEPPTP